jgi:hypothetical protein
MADPAQVPGTASPQPVYSERSFARRSRVAWACPGGVLSSPGTSTLGLPCSPRGHTCVLTSWPNAVRDWP